MRLFVGVPLSLSSADCIGGFLSALRPISGENIDFVKKSNLHLTLAFIGEREEYASVCMALKEVAKRHQPFVISSEGLSFFGRKGKGSVVIRFKDSEPLSDLAEDVRSELKKNNIPFDPKPFVSHVTIIKKSQPRRENIEPFLETISSFALFLSKRDEKNELEYEQIAVFPLNR
jgi:2'-5' RNA ligase